MNIVLNVRPSEQAELRFCRIHQPDMGLALQALETRVLLYAPRGEASHGYFGSAEIVDLAWDRRDPRFLILILEKLQLFGRPIAPSTVSDQATEGHEFYHYAPGIRRIDQRASDEIRSHTAGEFWPSLGLSEPEPTLIAGNADERQRKQREVMIRAQRLRLDVVRQYGNGCCVTGLQLGPLNGWRHEVEVCHIRSVSLGGPDDVTNAFPAIRSVHWAFDLGLFTIRPNRKILFRADASADLKWLFRGKTHARFPNDESARPKTEYLDFHYENVFKKGAAAS